jgi:hypothetical protein
MYKAKMKVCEMSVIAGRPIIILKDDLECLTYTRINPNGVVK